MSDYLFLSCRWESIEHLPDQRPAFDTANELPHVLRVSLMCKELITMAALALVWACEFWHRRTHVSCPPLMAFPTIQLSIPTANIKISLDFAAKRWRLFMNLPVERDFVLGTKFDDPKVHQKYSQPTKHRQQPNNVSHPSGFPVHGSIV